MGVTKALRENITQESIAYGYTLSVWGSGAMLLNSFQISSPDILFFILGGVLGFGFLAFSAYSRIFAEVENRNREKFIVGSMIHLLASLGTVAISLILIQNLSPSIGHTEIFLLVGINTTLTYNLLLLVEEIIYKYITKIGKDTL